jgi:hypothetical protein
MPRFLVEGYASEAGVEDARQRARRAAELGDHVVHLRTTFVPLDEMVLHVFDAPSAEVLDRAGRLAHLRFDRIVEAIEDGRESLEEG